MYGIFVDNLTEYEARALLMFSLVQNEGFLHGAPEKIKLDRMYYHKDSDHYRLVLVAPDKSWQDLFNKELQGVRKYGSLLDPEKYPVNSTRRSLPALDEFGVRDPMDRGNVRWYCHDKMPELNPPPPSDPEENLQWERTRLNRARSFVFKNIYGS